MARDDSQILPGLRRILQVGQIFIGLEVVRGRVVTALRWVSGVGPGFEEDILADANAEWISPHELVTKLLRKYYEETRITRPNFFKKMGQIAPHKVLRKDSTVIPVLKQLA
jgi:hypothetical protein